MCVIGSCEKVEQLTEAEGLTAYRVFDINTYKRALESFYSDYIYKAGSDFITRKPSTRNSSGFWTYKTVQGLGYYNYRQSSFTRTVFARVTVYGTVAFHTEGYRASQMRLDRMVFNNPDYNRMALEEMCKRHNMPVTLYKRASNNKIFQALLP